MTYQKEIDGLRALAVIPVILFHAGISGFSGGFVGVDIFFVISGYLIASLLLKELETDSFTLSRFYERRARRMLPALFLVLLVCLPVAWWLLLPHELEAFGRSLIAVSVFASNLLFWQESDYFAADAELIPLLHTWSLAVEEQYYLFFPLLLAAIWKWGSKRSMALLSILTLLSLLLAEAGWRLDAAANFYLLPSRSWELFAGALCALWLRGHTPKQLISKQLFSLTGLVMLLAGCLWLDDSIPYPGLYTVLPVTGTVLIILFAREDTLAGKLLSTRPLTAIGLISYSAYLWHQPLFAFVRLYYIEPPPLSLMLSLSLLVFVLAYLSWRFVEQPFRNRANFSQKQIFLLALLGSILFILLGIAVITQEGLPSRFS